MSGRESGAIVCGERMSGKTWLRAVGVSIIFAFLSLIHIPCSIAFYQLRLLA